MSVLSGEFKYEIGDMVYFRTASHRDGHRPKRFLIIERFLQQCHGGVQMLYKLDGSSEGIGSLIPEIALTPDEPPFERVSDAELEWAKSVIKKRFLRDESLGAVSDAIEARKERELRDDRVGGKPS